MTTQHALIVDDDHSIIDVLTMLLAKEGLTYTAVKSLRDVHALLDGLARVDVVFLSLEMPNSDSITSLPTLQAHPRMAGVPVVAYAVRTAELDTVRRAGFHSLLSKPINIQRFSEQLRLILSGKPVWDMGER
jgi:CheY-like chemotaxis protein